MEQTGSLLAFTHILGTGVISAMNLVMIGVGMSGDWNIYSSEKWPMP